MNTHDIEQHAAFENWARWFALPLGRVVSGERYESMETEAASKAWQAALASPEVKVLRDALKVANDALEAISDDMTVGDRWSNAGQDLLDALPITRAALTAMEKQK